MSAPIWFNDVDGPINVFPDDRTTALLNGWQEFKASPNRWRGMTDIDKEEAQWRPGGLRRYSIMYDPSITDRMRQMHEDGAVQLVWLTTWGYGANGELGQKLKWPRLESAGEPRYSMSGLRHTDDDGRWWKWPCVESYLDARPDVEKFIWTDDHLTFETHAQEWARHRGGLPIAIDETVGITHEHLDQVQVYLAADVQVASDGIR